MSSKKEYNSYCFIYSYLFQGLFPIRMFKTQRKEAQIVVFLRLECYLIHVRMYRHCFMIEYKLKLHIRDIVSRLNDNDEKKKLALSLSFRTEVRLEKRYRCQG
jgi:hypothetical protein